MDHSTAANELRPCASFSVTKEPQRVPADTLPVFSGPAALPLAAPPSSRHEGNAGQADHEEQGGRRAEVTDGAHEGGG